MSRLSKEIDLAFQGVGNKGGLEIWCIVDLQPVPVPKSSHGKFYSGNAYLVLNTVLPKSGPPQHDIHYWIGNDVNEVDSQLASDKALELDAVLGCCTVQYREVQGQETEKFLSYFKPCIIPVEGKYSSQTGLASETFQVSLLMCKGDHVVRVKEVLFCRSSLNHDDVFILDTASKIFLFAGCNSTTQERAKALEVVEYIKDNKHGGRCQVATVEDGKFVGDSDVGEFWSFFGGYAPIPRDSSSAVQEQIDSICAKLFWIDTRGELHPAGTGLLNKDILEKNKCYMLDCDAEVFVWMGRNTTITEKKTSISASEDFLRRERRSTGTHLTFLTEGQESAKFRSFFDKWPQTMESSLYDEGREKVAAIFKQQGYDVKELPDEEEDVELYTNCEGSLKVWHVDCDELSLLAISEQTKLFSGDCYVVQYTYPHNGKDEHLFYSWIGCESIQQDRLDVLSHICAVASSSKGDPVMAQVFEGNEPVRFFAMFRALVVFKGGRSSRYKMFLEEKGINVELSSNEKSLFRVRGSSPKNMQAIQVPLAATSLNSSYCYILRNGASAYTWIGSLSSASDHDLLDRMLDFIDPSWQPISVREGSEPDEFWDLLGGKGEYPKQKEMRRHIEEPHLFACTFSSNDFKVKEIYNFVQDDLTTEDVLLLDCQSEVYVWIGLNSNIKSKQQALTLGQKFLEMDILEEGLSVETPVYVVTEGHELPCFTRFFDWDPVKANMHGNSFERKLASLEAKKTSTGTPERSRVKSYSRENSLHRLGVSTEANSKFLNLRSSDGCSASHCTPVVRKLFLGSSPTEAQGSSTGSAEAETIPSSETAKVDNRLHEINADLDSVAYSYQQLRVDSNERVMGIDVTRREAYLSEEEFQEKFEMTKAAFYALPRWKQNKLKMALHLF